MSILRITLASCFLLAVATGQAPPQPAISQAWTAESTGDGLAGETGQESYLYENYPNKGGDPNGIRAHVWDYGASCKKIQVDSSNERNIPSGTYYMKCYAVNCCKSGDVGRQNEPKKWDLESSLISKVSYLGTVTTEELNNKTVTGAQAWQQLTKIPFTKMVGNNTYYVTKDSNGDVITHRIDYGVSGNKKVPPGSILYGNFKVQHNISEFRNSGVFMPPAECLKPNTLKCNNEHIERVERTYFKRSAAEKGFFA